MGKLSMWRVMASTTGSGVRFDPPRWSGRITQKPSSSKAALPLSTICWEMSKVRRKIFLHTCRKLQIVKDIIHHGCIWIGLTVSYSNAWYFKDMWTQSEGNAVKMMDKNQIFSLSRQNEIVLLKFFRILENTEWQNLPRNFFQKLQKWFQMV